MGEHNVVLAYRRHLKARHLATASVTAYMSWLRRLSDWSECSLLDLDGDDLEQWISEHDWKPATQAKAVQALRGFYGWALDTEQIDADPSVRLQSARVPRGQPNPCPEDVYDAALGGASGTTYWRLRLAAETGLRCAELASVHSSDVQRLVNGPVLYVRGKGGVERRVPLPEDLAVWVELQHGYVFATGNSHQTASSVGRWYKRHVGVKAHRLRHRYATKAYAQTRDLTAVQHLLGHASVSTTQVYVAVAGDDLAAAAAGAWQQRPRLHAVE